MTHWPCSSRIGLVPAWAIPANGAATRLPAVHASGPIIAGLGGSFECRRRGCGRVIATRIAGRRRSSAPTARRASAAGDRCIRNDAASPASARTASRGRTFASKFNDYCAVASSPYNLGTRLHLLHYVRFKVTIQSDEQVTGTIINFSLLTIFIDGSGDSADRTGIRQAAIEEVLAHCTALR